MVIHTYLVKIFSYKIFMEFLKASFPPTHELIATSRAICFWPRQWRRAIVANHTRISDLCKCGIANPPTTRGFFKFNTSLFEPPWGQSFAQFSAKLQMCHWTLWRISCLALVQINNVHIYNTCVNQKKENPVPPLVRPGLTCIRSP